MKLISTFIDIEKLPPAYRADAEKYWVPFAMELKELSSRKKAENKTLPVIIGINGCQGSGKSTLTKFLATFLKSISVRTATLSLDDFYLSPKSRQALAAKIHPLFVTRGVPGTHDVDFAIETINKLCKNHTTTTYLPRFDKANDNAASKSSWPAITGPVDVIILEGWFVGALPQRNEDLVLPVNDFERNCDADAIWRSYSNQALSRKYKDLFSKIDKLIMLRAPNFDAVYRWRCNQEESLRRAQKNFESTKVMTDQEVFRFIQHFERLTVHCLTTVPDRADIVFSLDSTQQIIKQKGSLSLD